MKTKSDRLPRKAFHGICLLCSNTTCETFVNVEELFKSGKTYWPESCAQQLEMLDSPKCCSLRSVIANNLGGADNIVVLPPIDVKGSHFQPCLASSALLFCWRLKVLSISEELWALFVNSRPNKQFSLPSPEFLQYCRIIAMSRTV